VPDQVDYYNHFGVLNRQCILACPEPELWTTDYEEKGRVYREMKNRIRQQQELITAHFSKEDAVLDIGCGFGRQAVMLARNGYIVTGIDTSDVFIGLAQALFDKQGYKGNFICTNIITENKVKHSYTQLLLLDVLEHIKPFQRRIMFKKLYEIAEPGAVLIVSLPHLKKRTISQFNNKIRRSITQHLWYFLRKEEHPYPIPDRDKILQLTKEYFVLDTFTISPETDYYVFHRS